MRRNRLTIAVAALAAASVGATADSGGGATAALRLDAKRFRPEVALTAAQRSRGLMFRTRAPVDGMLFVFPTATYGGFWMKNTLVPLRIVFYDSRGRAVKALRMTPCRNDPCMIYDPGKQYRYALELRARDPRPAKRLGPPAALRRLVLRAS